MPNVIFDINDSFATISRFAAQSVIEQLMLLTGINDAEIIYKEIIGHGKNAAAIQNPDAPVLKLDSNDYLIVEYKERSHEEVINTSAEKEEFIPIFNHPELGILVKPVCNKTVMTFDITYRSKSYNTLQTWLARFQRNKITRVTGNYHDLRYNYTLPDIIIAYIYDVYMLSSQVAPDDPLLSMKDWYAKYYTKGLMTRSNMGGQNTTFAVNINSKGNEGYYDSLPDDISTDKDKQTHEINFTYVLTFDKVASLILEYQLYIHNQRIDNAYDPFFTLVNRPVDSHTGLRTFSGQVLTSTERPDWYKLNMVDVFYEDLDRWHPPHPAKSTSTILMLPIQLNENDLTEIVDIDDVPSEFLNNTIKTIMKLKPEWGTKLYGFPLIVELFAVDNLTKTIPLNMDIDGNVFTNVDMDLRKRHYLRFSLLLDLTLLPVEVLRWLCQNPSSAIFILNMIDPNILIKSPIKYLAGGTIIDEGYFFNLINVLAGKNPYVNDISLSNTLGNYYNNSWNDQLFGYYLSTNASFITVRTRRE